MNYLTYSYLLTPLHTGASTQAGNLLGIAREAQTELPYIPSSSLRGKLRSSLESIAEIKSEAGSFFGERIKDGQQPTEGEVWFADATLLFFPVGSFSHQFLWITCPLWLSRWGRWLRNDKLNQLIEQWQSDLLTNGKKAITSASGKQIYLQGAILNEDNIKAINISNDWELFKNIPDGNGILDLKNKLVILSNEDCGALVEIGLQREVRIALDENEKIVARGSFRSEEAIPSETIMFFPWGMKPEKEANKTDKVREFLIKILNDRLQFGGLEGLGRGWTENQTIAVNKAVNKKGE
ncbi:MAG: CRISPR-associated protein Cmr4 [Aphanizomenon flos-aquae MDT14a]|jgi:CRISPR-associated protein Cmr4|uniref:CRISPR-associated protein Cmr4 n=1 Tax=Aphanizomenon flos-aquae LD13 TaxID=1710894 RepID=A0A1B7W1Y1_APHFL|nr:type III-B CRISPR module RAMP protein Cmr4 [Aphanizomenon flos-aquae UKL13-PB]OBQ27299.1 MAG: CRISPR-associated protein Cmr4 [Aphanizomenon flos-aquae LD13]OBQ27995.1 MAG: CRISPR-associated protein Cmr4 [Aphanizomenon flos-aquae MDT14a]HCQ21898.1 type III-B CRISPR module RAMP protein Cmr4 [Anabaena sp. UBA12330]